MTNNAKTNNASINYVSLKDSEDLLNKSNRTNTNNESVLFDLNMPHSLHFPKTKSKKNSLNTGDFRRRNVNKFATYESHDQRTQFIETLSNKNSKKRFERLNFEFTTTEIKHRQTWAKRNSWLGGKIKTRGLWKWCMCLAIGTFTGTCMFLISIAIETLVGLNLSWAQKGLKISFVVGFVRFLGVNCLFALISGSMVSFIAPAAAGSGIPAVKGWLNGSSIPGLFQMKTFLVKLIGVVFSVSAKFIIGKEGPMVHAGSALARGMALGRNKTLDCDTKTGHSFRNDVDGRDLISCGAAAGVAAAFGAPIGGMLFALEEVASFWLPGLTWRAFFSAAVSNLVLSLLLGCYHDSCGTASKASLIDFERSSVIINGKYNLIEFAFFIIMGAIGGLIGAAFNGINVRICLFRKKYLHKKAILRLWEVLLMAVFTSTLLIATPYLLPCKQIPTSTGTEPDKSYGFNPHSTCFSMATDADNGGQYTCKDGYYNPLSSLLLQSSENVIKGLFMYESECWDNIAQWLAAAVYFILAVTTYGLSIPSGLFIPLILIGSNVGHVVGIYWNTLFSDNFDVGTYSLIGASAVLGGSTRMTISLTAIIMEITNDIYFLMPIMITIMVSKWVGDFFNHALYDAHVSLKDIPYLEPKIPKVPSYICAEDIMRPDIVTLPSVIDLQSLLNVLNDPTNHHQAFPVLDIRNKSVKWLSDQGWSQKEGNFIGMILRWHIYTMLNRRCFSELKDPTFRHSKPYILKQSDLTDRAWKNKKTLFAAEFGLPERELTERYIDFTPYMSLSPTAVHRNTPVLTLYNLFKGVGLRHLVVIGNKRQIVGLITTHELNEEELMEAVERVHGKFNGVSESEKEDLWEQRIAFLKGYTKTLKTSGNAWLVNKEYAPDAHGKKRHGKDSGLFLDKSNSDLAIKSMTKSMTGQHEPGTVYTDDNKTDNEFDKMSITASQSKPVQGSE